MASNRERQQRAAARARLEREMTLRAEAAQRRKRLRAMIGGGTAVVVVIVAVVLLVTLTTGGKKKSAKPVAKASASPTACTWKPVASPSGGSLPSGIKDVGTPPASGEPRSGTQTMTIDTNVGTVKVAVDDAKTPCTAASFTYLASKKFFDNSPCHRLVTTGIFVLQCGDPSGSGTGGPAYTIPDENLPTGHRPTYPAGSVAMANTGQPNTGGSQFFLVYKDTDLPAQYTYLGKITSGLDVVQKVANAGDDGAFASQAGGGHPKMKVTITSLTMSPSAASSS